MRADWMREGAGWGLCFHYLDSPASGTGASSTDADAWNRRVDGFDVPRFAAQVAGTGAGWVIFTLGQNSGHYCSPNAAYDAVVGRSPSLCSRRDLFGEIAEALAAYGVRALAYLPSGAPEYDDLARARLGWENPRVAVGAVWARYPGGSRLPEFQRRWEAVAREWGERWGGRCAGWWIDGVYAPEMYRHPDAPNFDSLAAALRAGNPERVVCFNGGVRVPVTRLSAQEDYTAGEISNAFPAADRQVEVGGLVGGTALYHMLSYLGPWWGQGGQPRFDDDMATAHTAYVVRRGGVVTWDVPVSPDGTIPDPFLRQVSRFPRALSRSENAAGPGNF